MSGRLPKPTQLKIVEGNPGKRPLPKHEPKAPLRLPRAPVHMSKEAKKYWNSIGKQLIKAKIITELDAEAFELLCEAKALYIKASSELKKEMVVTSPTGVEKVSPYFAIAQKANETLRWVLPQFGMTPSGRVRVQTTDKDAKGNDFEGF